MKSDKIVIVGGGSAGWMTAAILIKSFPEKEIVLIESPNIPKVGVGESTYDGINYYLEYLEINRNEFFQETDASIKLGIEFVDFYEKDSGSFLYPFGRPYVGDNMWGMQDWMIKKYCRPETPNTDFAESYFPVALMIKHNTFYENADGALPNFSPRTNTALHFDAQKFATWLKEKYCIPRGVKYLPLEVDDIVCDEYNSIDYLLMSNKEKIKADLFIDCTGFRSLLLGETLGEPFISYNDILPNNRAWATQIPYKERETELDTVTRCTAINNGWVWNIPLYSRLGSGYVYSDKFVSSEDALKEFKEYLSSNKMLSPRTDEEIEDLSFKDIKIRVGRHERLWVNNVVAIGLSAAFIEPLESNGLFSVHEFLFQLVRALKRGKTSSWDIKVFNESTANLFEAFVEFVKLHYALSVRDDTDYWRFIHNFEYSFDRLSHKDSDSSFMLDLYNQKTKFNNIDHNGGFKTGIACISTGMNYPILDDISIKMGEVANNVSYKEALSEHFDRMDNIKNIWEDIAKNSPKLYQYLEEKYHGEHR